MNVVDLGTRPEGWPNEIRVRVLPGKDGAATVLYGGWGSDSTRPYALVSYEVDSSGAVATPQTLMQGSLGQFDAYVAPNGKQSLLWERVEDNVASGTTRWKTLSPRPLPDTVVYQSRESATAPWGPLELLSKTARSYNLDTGARLAPRLQPSGAALYAAWYEDRADGTAVGLQTAVTGYVAPTPAPTPTPTPPRWRRRRPQRRLSRQRRRRRLRQRPRRRRPLLARLRRRCRRGPRGAAR